jgi:hypothetical protein
MIHEEDLENIEELIKSSETQIDMTQSEYLKAMRLLHKENLKSVKEVKDHF